MREILRGNHPRSAGQTQDDGAKEGHPITHAGTLRHGPAPINGDSACPSSSLARKLLYGWRSRVLCDGERRWLAGSPTLPDRSIVPGRGARRRTCA
jgi:hypothetical protein